MILRKTASYQRIFAVLYNGIEIVLSLHTETHQIRYVKAQSDRSPFNTNWIYWSGRLSRFPGIPQTEAILLKRRPGKCPFCNLFFKRGDLLEIDEEPDNAKVLRPVLKRSRR